MGLWQVSFFVLPKLCLRENKFEFDKEGVFDDSSFWKSMMISCDFFYPISKILPQEKSWSDKIQLYGKQDSNRVEVFCENGIVESVSFRIDFTSYYETVLNELLEFFIYNGLIILDEELHEVPLNFETTRILIENSSKVKEYRKLSNQ